MSGKDLRKQGLNRIGNLLVPNNNYGKFEDWVLPIVEKMAVEQKESGRPWSPSRVIERLGREIDDESSVLYWAAKVGLPVFTIHLLDRKVSDLLVILTVARTRSPYSALP